MLARTTTKISRGAFRGQHFRRQQQEASRGDTSLTRLIHRNPWSFRCACCLLRLCSCQPLPIPNTANLIANFRVEGMFPERLDLTRPRPPVRCLSYFHLSCRLHLLLARWKVVEVHPITGR